MFITLICLIGILSLVTASIKSASLSKMRLIAAGLSQEGIEVVRDMRKAKTEWSDWYSGVSSGDYRVQYNSASLISYTDTSLLFDSNTGLYQYSSGNNSPFYRRVRLTKLSANEVKVLVEVKWLIKGNWHYLTAEDRLWNWK